MICDKLSFYYSTSAENLITLQLNRNCMNCILLKLILAFDYITFGAKLFNNKNTFLKNITYC